MRLSRGMLTEGAPKLAGGLAAFAFFLVVVVGGGVYRTDCVLTNGQMVHTLGLEGDIPYLWTPDNPLCRAHSLGRYVAGKFGLMSDVSESRPAWTPTLIQHLGAGSLAEAQVIPTIQRMTKTSGLFSGPQAAQSAAYLLQGHLNKLSASDLQSVQRASQNAAAVTGGISASLNELDQRLTAANGDGTVITGLPDGSRMFAAKWSRYLAATAHALQAIRAGLANMVPVYQQFPALIQAAYATARLRSTVQFDKVRQQVINALQPRSQQLDSAIQGLRNGSRGQRDLTAFVNSNQEAQSIVNKVNHDYPNGWLAQNITASGR